MRESRRPPLFQVERSPWSEITEGFSFSRTELLNGSIEWIVWHGFEPAKVVTMEINTIIFDFGGVIMTSEQDEAIRRFRALGITQDKMSLDKHTQTGLFRDFEEGCIGEEEFRSQLSLMAGHELSLEECQWACRGYVKEVPERNLTLFQQLREKGYRLLMLSNTNPYMMGWVMSAEFDGNSNGLGAYLDHCYLSYELGMSKPNPEIFLYVIECEKLNPSATIFVDDNELNIAVARKFGMNTLQPKNGEDWTGSLLAMLEE